MNRSTIISIGCLVSRVNTSLNQAEPITPSDLDQVIACFDREIEAFIESMAFPQNLHDAILYSVLGGGKRLRPVLAWYSSIACGGTGQDAIAAGIAVELIHAFSLIHDDLPALDNDDLRRGKPTLHKQTNEAMAILAGDALLSLAYESVISHNESEIGNQLVKELATGTRAMIVGQVFDTLGGMADSVSVREKLELIHTNKTGALLAAACRMGAISAHASTQQLEYVTKYANAIGLQFQIVDDLLDVEGSPEHVGKAIGKDAQAGKLTYPAVLGIEGSREIVSELANEASASIHQLETLHAHGSESLKQMGDMLTSRTK